MLKAKHDMDQIDVWGYGVLIDVYWTFKYFKTIDNNTTNILKTKDCNVPYREKNLDIWLGYDIYRNCWGRLGWIRLT
jgi:hypothetical protein